jgi:hypothetical protein
MIIRWNNGANAPQEWYKTALGVHIQNRLTALGVAVVVAPLNLHNTTIISRQAERDIVSRQTEKEIIWVG